MALASKHLKWLLMLLSFTLHVNVITAECNVCQENQAACVNSTSFYLCFGDDVPKTEVLYHCKDGFDCTNLNAICVQKNNARPPSCGDTSLCGMCSAHRNYVFACLSRTTFQMCYGALRPNGQIGYCPQGFICDANSDNVCVSTAQSHTITCDIVSTDPIPTTPTPTSSPSTPSTPTTPTTPTTTFPLTPNEVCEQMREIGLFPTMPHDPYCHRYIYCYYDHGAIKGFEYSCSSGSYYDIENERCTLKKPPYCV